MLRIKMSYLYIGCYGEKSYNHGGRWIHIPESVSESVDFGHDAS